VLKALAQDNPFVSGPTASLRICKTAALMGNTIRIKAMQIRMDLALKTGADHTRKMGVQKG